MQSYRPPPPIPRPPLAPCSALISSGTSIRAGYDYFLLPGMSCANVFWNSIAGVVVALCLGKELAHLCRGLCRCRVSLGQWAALGQVMHVWGAWAGVGSVWRENRPHVAPAFGEGYCAQPVVCKAYGRQKRKLAQFPQIAVSISQKSYRYSEIGWPRSLKMALLTCSGHKGRRLIGKQ